MPSDTLSDAAAVEDTAESCVEFGDGKSDDTADAAVDRRQGRLITVNEWTRNLKTLTPWEDR